MSSASGASAECALRRWRVRCPFRSPGSRDGGRGPTWRRHSPALGRLPAISRVPAAFASRGRVIRCASSRAARTARRSVASSFGPMGGKRMGLGRRAGKWTLRSTRAVGGGKAVPHERHLRGRAGRREPGFFGADRGGARGSTARSGRFLRASHPASPARRRVGPFIFFDHFGPARSSARARGWTCGRIRTSGSPTVTYLFDGEIIHRDSLGSHRAIQPGDINWMTAGRGIVHSERTRPERRARGARLHGLQLWVALPKEHEETRAVVLPPPARDAARALGEWRASFACWPAPRTACRRRSRSFRRSSTSTPRCRRAASSS